MPNYILRDVPPAIFERARAEARAEGKGLKQLIVELLGAYLETKDADRENADAVRRAH